MPNDSEDYLRGLVQVGVSFTGRGDVASYDLDQTTMTQDGAFHDWDLTSIVPIGTKLVLFRSYIVDGTVGRFLWVQQKGFVGNKNNSLLGVKIANKSHTVHNLLPVDSNDRLLEYLTTSAVIDLLGLVVLGWWS